MEFLCRCCFTHNLLLLLCPTPLSCTSPLFADDVSIVDMWAVRETIDDMLCTFHPFHAETARALHMLVDSLRFPAFVFVAEVRTRCLVFCQSGVCVGGGGGGGRGVKILRVSTPPSHPTGDGVF